MINELINQLKQLEPGQGQFEMNGSKVTYNITPNSYSIHIVSKGNDHDEDKCSDASKQAEDKAKAIKAEAEKLVNGFTKELDKLTDDVFVASCDKFENMFDMTINDLNKKFLDGKDLEGIKKGIVNFKNAVNTAVIEEINKLKAQMFEFV